MRLAALLAGLFLLLGSPARGQEETFADEITVSLRTVVVRVVDTWGRPVLGLGPEDFRAEVGGEEIPVVAAEWVTTGESLPAGTVTEIPEEAPEVPVASPGRLFVFFVQADLNPTRVSGHMRIRTPVAEMLETLGPEDRVAVVSFDSHLKLRQDFTRDPAEIQAALDRSLIFGEELPIEPGGPVSLARHLDASEAWLAASPERALEVTARALAAFPGEKMMIFQGWGLGSFGIMGTRMKPSYAPAVRALRKARVSVFVLDVTSADEHSLGIGLESVAADTGGLYLKTFRLPNLATEVLGKLVSGYYVLTLDRALLPEGGGGPIEVQPRDRRWSVIGRPVALR
jgi:VWFA-related protein